MTNWTAIKASLDCNAKNAEEWLNKAYPEDIFKTPFDRKQIAWLMACYLQEQIYDKFYLSEIRP